MAPQAHGRQLALITMRPDEPPIVRFVSSPWEEADAIAAQAEGLAFADALRRVRAVDEVRELLEHNIRESVALLRLARAVSRPAG